jgi:hypothetical protein
MVASGLREKGEKLAAVGETEYSALSFKVGLAEVKTLKSSCGSFGKH